MASCKAKCSRDQGKLEAELEHGDHVFKRRLVFGKDICHCVYAHHGKKIKFNMAKV